MAQKFVLENLFRRLFYTELHFNLAKQTAKPSTVYYAKAIIVNNENFYGEIKRADKYARYGYARCAP